MLNTLPTSFAGRASAYLITRPVAKTDTFRKGVVSMQETDKQFVLRRLEIQNFIQAYSPTPIDNSLITYSEVITPISLMNIYTTFNPVDLKETWSAEDMQREMLNLPLAQNDTTYLLAHMFDLTNLFIGQLIWRGDVKFDTRNSSPVSPTTVGLPLYDGTIQQNTLSIFDGLIKQIQNDATANNLTGGIFSATNSVGYLQQVYNAITSNSVNSFGNYVGQQTAMVGEYGDEGLRFVYSKQTEQFVEQGYNIVTTFKNWSYSENIVNNAFLGYEMLALAEFPNNTILASYCSTNPLRSQLFFYYNSADDQSNLEIRPLPFPSDIWGIKGTMKIGAGTGWMDQITLLTNLNYVGN